MILSEEPTSVSILSKEQLLKIQIKLPDLQDQIGARTLTHLVLVVDNSGSMSGNPWQQVNKCKLYHDFAAFPLIFGVH